MYKVLVANEAVKLENPMNEYARKGFVLMKFASVGVDGWGHEYVAIMHKPDTAPVPHMTTEQYLAVRTPLERLAATADEVLREEARQYGVGK